FNARNSLAIPGQNVFPGTPKTGPGKPVGEVIETTGAGAKRDIEQGQIPRLPRFESANTRTDLESDDPRSPNPTSLNIILTLMMAGSTLGYQNRESGRKR